jgi:2-hydroxy-4-carboxymuconate semialdehyde hemiacetal dehydrogenase
MSAFTPPRLCLVGAGGIARQHMEAFSEIGIEPRWVICRTLENASRFAREWNFPHWSTDLDKALEDQTLDLVLLCSPSGLHAGQAVRCLEAGKHVIIEIPVALSLADAQRVKQVAREQNRRVFVCHTMRSFPSIVEVRRRVQSGSLHLSQIAGYFGIPRRKNESWAGQRHWIDNLLWHHGCHQVDAAMWILGIERVERVHSFIGRRHSQFGMALDVSIQFITRSGQLVSQALSYNTAQFVWEQRFLGDELSLTFRNGKLLDEQDQPVLQEHTWLDLRAQNRAILTAFHQSQPSDFDLGSVLGCMQALDAAERNALEFSAAGSEAPA